MVTKIRQALVIGGTTGIGRAIADRLIEDGLSVCVTGANPDNVAAIKASGTLDAIQLDVADHAQIDARQRWQPPRRRQRRACCRVRSDSIEFNTFSQFIGGPVAAIWAGFRESPTISWHHRIEPPENLDGQHTSSRTESRA